MASAAAPPLVDWQNAGDHAGQVVTVEGDVKSARCAEDTCALDFAPEESAGFRIVVLMPMFARAAEQPDRVYAGRRIRATGKVQRFQGRVEMVVRGTSQLELADVSPPTTVPAPAAPSTTRPSPPPAIAPPAAVPGARVASPPPAAATPPVPTATTLPSPPAPPPQPLAAPSSPTAPPAIPPSPPQQQASPAPTPTPPTTLPPSPPVAPGPSCEQAKARWREIAGDVKSATVALERCFRALPYHCHPESTALAALLPALDEAERQADAACR